MKKINLKFDFWYFILLITMTITALYFMNKSIKEEQQNKVLFESFSQYKAKTDSTINGYIKLTDQLQRQLKK